MKRSVLLSLIPAVLGCANINTNACAKAVASNVAGCADVGEGPNIPEWASGCSRNNLMKECKCQYTAGGDADAPVEAPTAAATTLATRVASSTPKATEQPATAPSTGSSASSDSCGSAQVDQLVGYGDGTTGGSGNPVTVKSCSELTSALSNGGVIHIEGHLTGCDIMMVKSDTTILGVGANAGLTDSGFRIKKANNVIIRNLAMNNPPKEMDLIDIESSTYIWIDHNEFSAEGITGDKDFYDGLLDAKRGSDFMTFSWNKFSDHWKASLIGHSDSNGEQDTGKLHVTYHHNHWSNVNSRTPSIRFGTAHIYSSCYEDLPTSGVNSRMGAQVLVEATAFINVRRPIITNLDSKEDGFASEKSNLFENSEPQITQEKNFTPPYEYTVSLADCICELVKAKAGTGVVSV
ncbi:putative pectate lyase 1 [Fusarium austroafricanum]|uniref:Putative pectate lyase 1 n=1 Tax=Fusarium austroafricanum TaxID=2364996 RepID=A0A8H4NIT2_9HYPO|nr:putative pectate lyase 1 [Fusarium austroafricanum]